MKNHLALRPVAVLFALLALFVLPSSCITNTVASEAASGSTGSSLEVDNARTGMADLTVYLQQLSGVLVQGDGPGATITVRGVTSVNMETSPLFVVDGMPIGTSYEEIYNTIDVQQVKNVRVLKSSVETSMYGVRGANGVIEIERN